MNQTKTQISAGCISENEITYMKKGRKIKEILVRHYTDLAKLKLKIMVTVFKTFTFKMLFEEYLCIEIQIYNLESRQIYNGNVKIR